MVFYLTDIDHVGSLCRKGLMLLSHEEANLLLTSAGLLSREQISLKAALKNELGRKCNGQTWSTNVHAHTI